MEKALETTAQKLSYSIYGRSVQICMNVKGYVLLLVGIGLGRGKQSMHSAQQAQFDANIYSLNLYYNYIEPTLSTR